jgi:hypothetical protein
MATIPKIVTLTNTSIEVLNAIKNSATQNYKDYVPYAQSTEDGNNIREIGAVIMDSVDLQNEFLSALVNRIGRVLVTSKMYDNPWKMFKKGILELGETVEEIFVNLAKPHQYDPNGSATTLYQREIPDVRSAFHVLNFQKFYKDTIQNEQLRQAFLSIDGITDLISKIITSMYTAANYDEFQVMKYMVAKHILNGKMYPVEIPEVTKANMTDIVSVIKGTSNDFVFMQTTYNVSGVYTHTEKSEQYVLLNSKFDAKMSVEVLATAFNMDKAEFMGHTVLVDSFGKIDSKRLAELFKDDASYVALTDVELSALDAIPAVLIDRDWFMIFDNLFEFRETPNNEGLYWNYVYHTWKTFSVSPFKNNALFIPGTPAVTGITLSPNAVTVGKGGTAYFVPTVATQYFAPKSVVWSINSDKSVIDNRGKLTVGADETALEITVTATSTFDGTVTGTATVTIG